MSTRYHSLAIILHWVMALAILLMLASGLTMAFVELTPAFKFNLYQWHKALGVLVLMAATLRLTVRLLTHPPRLPDFGKWETRLAKLGHWALYGLMFAMPITGWLIVSTSVYGLPTIVFGWFQWPHIPGIAGHKIINDIAQDAHWYLALALLALLVGHVGAVVKHAAVDKYNLLTRMWWGKDRTNV
jgi:cytochrome b561